MCSFCTGRLVFRHTETDRKSGLKMLVKLTTVNDLPPEELLRFRRSGRELAGMHERLLAPEEQGMNPNRLDDPSIRLYKMILISQLILRKENCFAYISKMV
jgi:hypothetical protein